MDITTFSISNLFYYFIAAEMDLFSAIQHSDNILIIYHVGEYFTVIINKLTLATLYLQSS